MFYAKLRYQNTWTGQNEGYTLILRNILVKCFKSNRDMKAFSAYYINVWALVKIFDQNFTCIDIWDMAMKKTNLMILTRFEYLLKITSTAAAFYYFVQYRSMFYWFGLVSLLITASNISVSKLLFDETKLHNSYKYPVS
jgi:hypothetical protein